MHSNFEVTSLFQPQPRTRGGGWAYAISMTLHGSGIAFGFWVLVHYPMVRPASLRSRYEMRELRLHMPEHVPSVNDELYPTTPKHARAAAKAPQADAPKPDAPQQTAKDNAPPLPPVPTNDGAGKQVLLQPRLHVRQQLAEKVPVPNVVMWMPELNRTKVIVAPHPDKPTFAMVKPSLVEPNEQLDMSSLSVAAADLQPKIPTPPAGTTSPLMQNGPSTVKMAPTTVSDSSDPPTPTAVLSVSNLRMPDGVAVLPPTNETSGSGNTGAGAPHSGTSAGTGQAGGNKAPGGSGNNTAGNGSAGKAETGASGSSSTSAQDAASETVDHIQLPPNGRFGVVVVGSSQAAQYPEASDVWTDRVAYTVYLHVGLPKTWILQYGLAHAAQANGSGSVSRLEAPWPYDIFRPNLLAVDINADALMVHGILNASGKLEQLAIAFPEGFPRASFVVNALSRWQFRPASQDGKPTSVEVLLIIPEEDD